MSPVYDPYLQHRQPSRMQSHPQSATVALGEMDWPRGHSRGGEGGGGRRGDWQAGMNQPPGGAMQEPGGAEALQRRLRVDVHSPVRLTNCVCVCVFVCLPQLLDAVWV